MGEIQRLLAESELLHEVRVVPEQPLVVHRAVFQCPIVAMPMAKRLPVGAIDLPSGRASAS